eukprot:gene20594-27392_t
MPLLSVHPLSPREKSYAQVMSPSLPSFSRSLSHQRQHRRGQFWLTLSRSRVLFLLLCATAMYIHACVPMIQNPGPAVRRSAARGHWVEDYALLHHKITTGKAKQRYAFMRSKNAFENGLADRISSSLSILLYAILTDRAFQYDWEGDWPLWDFLRSDHIDWQYNGADLGNDTLLMDYVMDKGIPEYHSFFWEQDPTKIGEGKHSVVWHSDHGIIWKAFENPLLRPKLDALGMHQETAFACLFDFLYRPTPDILQLLEDELSPLLDPNVLKKNPGLFRHYFECAKQIEDELAFPGQKVVWFTLTDMTELRPRLEAMYPSRVLVASDATIEHMVKSTEKSLMGFKYAVGELWAFSLTDYHVITRKSGFGKVGAMVRANGDQHVFSIEYPIQLFNLFGLGGPAIDNRKVVSLWQLPKNCRSSYADKLSKICTDFTGI